MKKNISQHLQTYSLLICIFSVTFYGLGQCRIDYDNFDLVWQEDFDGTEQDLENDWAFDYRWGRYVTAKEGKVDQGLIGLTNEDPNDLTVQNGLLYLRPSKLQNPLMHEDRLYHYSSGMLRTKIDDEPACNENGKIHTGYLYGMFEIRCKMPVRDGMYAAFWLYGGSEIDVFEYAPSDGNLWSSSVFAPTQSTFLPGWELNKKGDRYVCPTYQSTQDNLNDFHTYTLIWTPTSLAFYYDGVEYRVENRWVPTDPCFWQKKDIILENNVVKGFTSNNQIQNSNSDFVIDYVRVYKQKDYNLPYNTNGWNWEQTDPSVFNASGYTAIRENSTGGHQLFYKGTDNRLWNYYEDQGQWNFTPLDWSVTNVSGHIALAPGNASNVYYKGTDNRLWNFYWHNGAWHNAPLSWGVTNVSGYIKAREGEVFYKGTDNRLWRFYWENGAWHNTPLDWSVTNVSSHIELASQGSNIFYKGTDNRLWNFYWDNGAWHNAPLDWSVTNVQGFLATKPGKIFYKGTDNRLWNFYWDNGAWHNAPLDWGVNNVARDIVVSPNASNVYYKGTDNRLWNFYWDNGAWHNEPLRWWKNNVSQGLVTHTNGLYYINNNNQLNHFYWSTCNNLNRVCDKYKDYFEEIQKKPITPNDPSVGRVHEISPNPGDGHFVVRLNPDSEAIEQIQVRNSMGNLVAQKTIENVADVNFDISNENKGLYGVFIISKSGIERINYVNK